MDIGVRKSNMYLVVSLRGRNSQTQEEVTFEEDKGNFKFYQAF